MLTEFIEIKKLRELAGLTQAELAKRVGVSQSFIAKLENGKIDPKFSVIKKIFYELNNILDIKDTANSIMHRPVICAYTDENVIDIVTKMEKNAISQIPVINIENKLQGIIYDYTILRKISKYYSNNIYKLTASKVMTPLPPLISENTSISEIMKLLSTHSVVLVTDKLLHPIGIITRSDLIEFIIKHRLGEPQ
ncbi:CBS domain-containing protein [Acidianus manzaensis]|uniref:XRE family transcriptional regulator n=1 Tax=Acidianus manzaensis TaxID=282676 RepID=A0A1W6JZW8_9CREN|nr:CBS domain-containing protein [Acidianus manzaensis]ARM75871.1 XRE family transcriptional regulator [Acidianus manzaensis]